MMEDKINQLKSLISDYEYSSLELSDMIFNWENNDDPMSDPGLQYEKECEITKLYNKIVEFSKTL